MERIRSKREGDSMDSSLTCCCKVNTYISTGEEVSNGEWNGLLDHLLDSGSILQEVRKWQFGREHFAVRKHSIVMNT